MKSARNIKDLVTIRLLNYRQAQKEATMIKMQLEWRRLGNPYKSTTPSEATDSKVYMVDRVGLQEFIQSLQRELLSARYLNVSCIIS